MSGPLLEHQSGVSNQNPMIVGRADDTSVVNTSLAEVVIWLFNDSGAWAAAATEAAGTICTYKTTYSGILNSVNAVVGHAADTSLAFAAATRAASLVSIPETIFSAIQKLSVADQVTEMTKHLGTAGNFAIDHLRGQVWLNSLAEVANDAIAYDYLTPISGGTGPTSDKIQGNVAHDDVDAGNPVSIGGIARSAQQAVVAVADRVKAVFNLSGELVLAGYDWATQSLRSTETDPLSGQYANTSLVDTTNITAATHYYPSSTGETMDGYADLSCTGKFIDADGTLTLTLEVSNDEDSTNADWNAIKFFDDDSAVGALVASLTVTNGTLLLTATAPELNYKRYRWVVVASGATNTVILKGRSKTL